MPASSILLLALVTVVLKGGGEAPARTVRTDRSDLVLALEGGSERRIPLSEVAEIRFEAPPKPRPPEEGEERKKLLPLLARIRRSPFAGEPLPAFPLLPARREEEARKLERRIAREPGAYRKIQDSIHLAALRFSQDDLEGCRESLRRIKSLCRESDPGLYDATCARLSALELKADGSAPSPAWKDELFSGLKGQEDREAMKTRIRAVDELAGKVR